MIEHSLTYERKGGMMAKMNYTITFRDAFYVHLFLKELTRWRLDGRHYRIDNTVITTSDKDVVDVATENFHGMNLSITVTRGNSTSP